MKKNRRHRASHVTSNYLYFLCCWKKAQQHGANTAKTENCLDSESPLRT